MSSEWIGSLAGTLLIALMLAAYALAKTIGQGRFGQLNMGLLLAAVVGAGLFVFAETKAASPLIQLTMLRNPVLNASLATKALVSTVMMATLVVGPFNLSRALGLHAASVGIVMSAGPLVAALTGVPGRTHRRPFWRNTHDHCRAHRDFGLDVGSCLAPNQLIVVGLIAHTCVEATVRYAAELGYEVTIVKDSTASYSNEEMHAALDVNIPNYATAVVTTDEIADSISSLSTLRSGWC